MPAHDKHKAIFRAALAGGVVAAIIGVLLVGIPRGNRLYGFAFGGTLARLSYDVPFALRTGVPEELVIVYVDPEVKAALGEPKDPPLNRKYYAQLSKRLERDGAKLIFFDFTFDEPGKDPLADQEFADAIREHGRVVLVADYVKQFQGNVAAEVPVPPLEPLAKAAAGWGLARLLPDESDGVFRRLDPGAESCPSAAWVAARLLNAPAAQDESRRGQVRWLNYYGPPITFCSVNLNRALQPDELPDGFFRDKLVVVGSRPDAQLAATQNDQFPTPFSRSWNHFSPGAGVHAQTLLNLLHGDWLREISTAWQLALVIGCGTIIGAGLTLVRPWHAAWLAVLCCSFIGATAVYLQFHENLWWSWLIPVAVQTPVALVWSVGWHYALESRRRNRLRQAFAGYLSPHLADRIAAEEFDLSLGGKTVEATVMFSDLDGFTSVSETLAPEKVSHLLTSYFNRATRGILDEEGTIIKYMGDSVMAVWGAPLPDAKQADRAVIAAWRMIKSTQEVISGKVLRTRIGINTGPALAGNLGSDFRFDYAVIGDTTNTASRLENLNKQLGTDILISESTHRQLTNRVSTRTLGQFLLSGKSQPVAVYQVLGVDSQAAHQYPWVALFETALQHFVNGEFDLAESSFCKVSAMKGIDDGPSKFYLAQIAAVRSSLLPGTWRGVVRISSK
jgi:adenylate cyclase